jgi:hypothetical protein
MRTSAPPSSNGSPPDRLWRLIYTLATSPEEHVALLGSLFWTGVGTAAGCSFALASALAEISAAEVAIIVSSEPLWGALIARQMLGEIIGAHTFVGACLVVAACAISASDGKAELRAYRRVRAVASSAWAYCHGLRGLGSMPGTTRKKENASLSDRRNL